MENFSKSLFFLLDLLLIKPAVSKKLIISPLYLTSQLTESLVVCKLGDVKDKEISVILLNNVDLPVFSLPKMATVFFFRLLIAVSSLLKH